MGILDELERMLAGLGYHVNVSAFLIVFGLALTRIATGVTLAPFLGQAVTSNIKIGLAVVMTAVLLPGLSNQQQSDISPLLFVALLIKEAMIGAVVGFLAQLIFYAVQMAGALIDTQRGMDQPGLFTPQLPGNVSALGQLQFQAAVVIFLFLNGHLIYLKTLGLSFERLPLFGFPRLAGPVSLAEQIGQISGQVFVIALQISAPVLVTLFLVDVVFGAIGKMASQINIQSDSMTVKSFVGLLILFLSIGFIFTRLEGVLSQMLWNIYTVLERMA